MAVIVTIETDISKIIVEEKELQFDVTSTALREMFLRAMIGLGYHPSLLKGIANYEVE